TVPAARPGGNKRALPAGPGGRGPLRRHLRGCAVHSNGARCDGSDITCSSCGHSERLRVPRGGGGRLRLAWRQGGGACRKRPDGWRGCPGRWDAGRRSATW
ncbi:unnamed protein product, partial [Prorocentrum cordatum]